MDWQARLRASCRDPQQLAERFAIDPAPLAAVAERYPLSITPQILDLLEGPGDPLWRQWVPDPAELADAGLPEDPLHEEALAPVPQLVHRYPDRALLLVANSCAGYCRFCTRKRRVGSAAHNVAFGEILAGIDYIARTPAIRDVLISGGEPLLLSDRLLDEILGRLRRIAHVEIIRIGSRAPVTLPERIDSALCALLRRHAPLYLNTHFNHPRELTPAAAEACRQLADAGIVLGNQTVLLAGVNDAPETLHQLFAGLLRLRVRPYYLHHLDLTRGTGHFRVPLERGLEILKALRGRLSGLAIPQYVVDLPGGKGKVPLVPDCLEHLGPTAVLRAPDGSRVELPNTTRQPA